MKKIVLGFIFLFAVNVSKAQWLWDFGGTMGATNYLGDIGGKEGERRDFISDIKLVDLQDTNGGQKFH